MAVIGGVEAKEGKVCKPAFVVVMTVGYNETFDGLKAMSANLLKEWRATIHEKTALTDANQIADAFAHAGKWAIITKHPDINSLICHASPHRIVISMRVYTFLTS